MRNGIGKILQVTIVDITNTDEWNLIKRLQQMTQQCQTQGCEGNQISKGMCRRCYYNTWMYGQSTKPDTGWRRNKKSEVSVLQDRIAFFHQCYLNASNTQCLIRFAKAVRECEHELRELKGVDE